MPTKETLREKLAAIDKRKAEQLAALAAQRKRLKASLAKLERVCAKLGLCPQDHVLEIGTGWGGFAVHAAQRYGCRVTTTTISVAFSISS